MNVKVRFLGCLGLFWGLFLDGNVVGFEVSS